MKIIILGAGRVGRTLAEQLLLEHNDVTLVDSSPHPLTYLSEKFDLCTVVGNAAFPEVLEKAGAHDADMIIAVTASDEVNMLACEIAHHLFKTPSKIARIRNNEYIRYPQLFNAKAIAVDILINPEDLVINYVSRLVEYPNALQVLDFAHGKIELVMVKALKDAPLIGQPLRNVLVHLPSVEAKIVAISRQGKTIIPEPDTIIEVDDDVFFIAGKNNVREVISELRGISKPPRNIMIAGGGNIGLGLARALENDYHVKVITRDKPRARRLAEKLQKAIVLHGNAVDETLLFDENINDVDVFCALTDDDEINIMSATLAKRMGVRKVMALINRQAYITLIQNSTVDIVISSHLATMNNVLSHLRRGDVVQAHSLGSGNAEALEAIAHGNPENSKIIGKTVEQIPLPQGASIAAIVRAGIVMIAQAQTMIMPEDHVILFVPDKRDIPQIERLFQVGLTFF
ncbi:MAG: Trk system potassium transporter TrkA [Legionellales bacterium]|jgi:trk system potassium uptake protein TrkA